MRLLLSIIAAVAVLAPAAFAASPLEITLPNGEVKTFTREDLEALPQLEVTRKIGDQPERLYSGPAVEALLLKCGIPVGDKTKRELLRYVLLATGADGYAVTLSMAEVDSGVADGKILIAVKRDHLDLPPEEGPLRLAVEKDHRPARWVKISSNSPSPNWAETNPPPSTKRSPPTHPPE
jgi:hypothetical protein